MSKRLFPILPAFSSNLNPLNNPSHNAHRILHDMTRQLPTRKSYNVRGSTTRRVTTRQKSGFVVSDLTMLDICDKARYLSCRIALCRRPRTLHDFLVGSCVFMSRRVMCGGHLGPGPVNNRVVTDYLLPIFVNKYTGYLTVSTGAALLTSVAPAGGILITRRLPPGARLMYELPYRSPHGSIENHFSSKHKTAKIL